MLALQDETLTDQHLQPVQPVQHYCNTGATNVYLITHHAQTWQYHTVMGVRVHGPGC